MSARPQRRAHGDGPSLDWAYVFAGFLRCLLGLRPEHRARLRARGLGDAAIAGNGYASAPRSQCERDRVAAALAPFLNISGGAPGFYRRGSSWAMVYSPPGFYVPVRDEYLRVTGLQLRADDPRDGKYVWLSSNPEAVDAAGRLKYPGGASSGTPPHFELGARAEEVTEIVVTEGPLKADAVHSLSGLAVVGVAGVNNARGLATRLRANLLRLRVVKVAFDMDVVAKPQVRAALERLVAEMEAERFRVSVLAWPPAHKGLDDYLLAESLRREVAA